MLDDDLQSLIRRLKAKIIRHKKFKLDDEEEYAEGKITLAELRFRAEKHNAAIDEAENELQFYLEQSQESPSVEVTLNIATPKGYEYVDRISANRHRLIRTRDQQEAMLLVGGGKSYLVDRYAVTCEQFVEFLNDICSVNFAHVSEDETQICADRHGKLIAVASREPSRQSGIFYEQKRWVCSQSWRMLPITSVTWWGAVLYGRWSHNVSLESQDQIYLLDSNEWLNCAVHDFEMTLDRKSTRLNSSHLVIS